ERNFEEIKKYNVNFISFNEDATNPDKRWEIINGIRNFLPLNGKLMVMVHSIAKGNLKPMFPVDKSSLGNSDFHHTLDAMAFTLYDWTRDLIKANLFADDVRIISFTSEGNNKALPSYGAVSAAKATLEAITRNMALEFAPLGIKANCIQAGGTDSASLQMITGSENKMMGVFERDCNCRVTTAEVEADV